MLTLVCAQIRDLFAMQLLRISGMSPPKAAAIVAQYATPMQLCRAFENSNKPEKLLKNLEWQAKKRLGPALSKKIHEHFTCC